MLSPISITIGAAELSLVTLQREDKYLNSQIVSIIQTPPGSDEDMVQSCYLQSSLTDIGRYICKVSLLATDKDCVWAGKQVTGPRYKHQ